MICGFLFCLLVAVSGCAVRVFSVVIIWWLFCLLLILAVVGDACASAVCLVGGIPVAFSLTSSAPICGWLCCVRVWGGVSCEFRFCVGLV